MVWEGGAGYYLNKHTKKYLKKRKLEDERNARDSNCITYNLLYMPRILKTDLRRQYPVMFVNAFNSCNNEYIQGFVNKFLRDDTTFILEAPCKTSPSSPPPPLLSYLFILTNYHSSSYSF